MEKPQEQTKEGIEALIKDTVNSINEVLAKSGYPMAKAEGDGEGQPDGLEQQAQAEGAPGAEAPAAPAPEAPAAPAEGAPAPGAEGQGAPGAEGGDDMQAMQQHLAGMPDEELHMLLEMLQGEMMKRQEGQQGAPGAEGGAPAPAAPAAPAPEGENMEMSMKKEFASMAKSIDSMAKAVESLAETQKQTKSEVADLKKSQAAKPAASVATQRPAQANRTQVQVLAKSGSEAPKIEKMSKSDLEGFVMNEMRKSTSQRHPAINSGVVAEMTYVKSQDEVDAFATRLRKAGVPLPA